MSQPNQGAAPVGVPGYGYPMMMPMMQMPMQAAAIPTQVNQSAASVEDSNKKAKAIKYDGFDSAAKELTLSADLMKDLPINIRDWKPSDVQKWLKEVFDEAEDLPT